MWSDKMRNHLTSLHKSIWDIVEYGAKVPKKGDKDYDSEEVDQIRHFNSQATTILLASLSREEYNKVQGLKSAKEIWDVLKTAHEGDEVTKITKRETIEEELSRFMLNQENKKHVKVKNAYAQEIEKCEKLTSELSICHDIISNLRNENVKLIAKVDKLNVCDNSLINLKNDNASLISKIDKMNKSLSSLRN
jgi:hypothetical protein